MQETIVSEKIDFCKFSLDEYAYIETALNKTFEIKNFLEIRTAYEKFIKCFESEGREYGPTIKRSDILPRTNNNNLFLNNYKDPNIVVGIDIPALLRPSNNNGQTVFIIAQDPRRPVYPEYINKYCDVVELSTPFGTHLIDFREKGACKIYWSINKHILNKGYSVYLSDIFKLWQNNLRVKSQDDILGKFDLSMQDEINFFRPSIIITYGIEAQVHVKALKIHSEIKIISFPHPAQTANGSWKKLEEFNNKRCSIEQKTEYMIGVIDKLLK